MDGCRLGCNVSLKNSSSVTLTVLNRETRELQEIVLNNQDFIKRLIGKRKWFSRGKFVIDKIGFGFDAIKNI